MEQNKDSKKPGTWFWDLPGSAELSIPSADFKKSEKKLLQAVRKAYGDSISDMSLQDVHYNLPIGSNRKKMENNIVNLLREDIDNSPLSSYSTIAEDDKFVIVGDTQSKDIRAYRKLSEEEVSKALTDYAKHNDISIAPMDKELQELASKILVKSKEQVGEIYTKLKYNNNEQNTLSMPQKKETEMKQERASQVKQDASSVEKTAKIKLPEDSSLKYNVFLNGAADHMSNEEMDAYFKMTSKEKDEFLNKIRQNAEESKVENAVKYNVFLNGAADHMSNEEMDAYFKMTPREKDAYLAKLDTKQSKAEKQHRPPQMVTVNGQKVTHAHAFQSNKNPEDWFFTAKLDGQQLRPQIMTKEDVKAYQEKDFKVEELMQHYYPTKLAKKITPEEYKTDTKLSDGRTVDRMVVYKEHDENRPDVGKYKLYAQVGDKKMSRTMSKEDLNAYFDRVTTPAKLVEKNFGEQLHMASAYKKYQLPENSGVERVSIHKNSEGRYVISANMGDKGMTPERKMEWNDLYSYFTAKTVTREQLAAKYLMSDIRAMHSQKNDVSRGLKI